MRHKSQIVAGSTFLERIVSHVRERVASGRAQISIDQLVNRPLYEMPRRDFARSLASASGRRIIAEVKRASPSKGLIREDFDPVAIAKDYAANGAAALSVVTEERFFGGSLDSLSAIREAVSLPVLRKDFIVDPYQVVEARSFGADAILLIATILEKAQLRELHEQARALSLDTLVEVHTQEDLYSALEAGVHVVGINNRDLHTFEVDLSVSEGLLPQVPGGVLAICESGIGSVEQLRRLERSGGHVFLIGETLMRAPSPGAKLAELLG